MKKVYLFAALAAGMTFASCTNDDDVNVNDNSSANLMVENVGVSGLNSRAGITALEFTNGESIGVYLYDETKDGSTGKYTYGNYNDGADGLPTVNVEYTQANPWSATQPIVVSTKKGVVFATYPYDAANTDPSKIKINVAENQGSGQSNGIMDVDVQKDYMWATPIAGISNKDAKIDLTMNHALAMATFKFKQVEKVDGKANVTYPGVGNVTSIKLYNSGERTNIKAGAATMNIEDGIISGAAVSANGITVEPKSDTLMDVDDESELPRMLLYPTSEKWTAGDILLDIVVDGNTYRLNVPALSDGGFVAGKNYIYTLTMKGTELEITTVSIKEWEDVDDAGAGDIQTPVA